MALKVFLQGSSATTFTGIFLADKSEFLQGQTNTRDSSEKTLVLKIFLSSSGLYDTKGVWVELKPRHGARGLHGLPWIAIAPLALAGDLRH